MEKLQSFLGLETLLRKEHFVFNQVKGFFCLKHPITSEIKCMGNDKGRSHPKINEANLQRSQRFCPVTVTVPSPSRP